MTSKDDLCWKTHVVQDYCFTLRSIIAECEVVKSTITGPHEILGKGILKS